MPHWLEGVCGMVGVKCPGGHRIPACKTGGVVIVEKESTGILPARLAVWR